MKSKLTYTHYEDVNKSFDMRPDLVLERQENLPPPPGKKKKSIDKGKDRFASLEEEAEYINYDEIAEQQNISGEF